MTPRQRLLYIGGGFIALTCVLVDLSTKSKPKPETPLPPPKPGSFYFGAEKNSADDDHRQLLATTRSEAKYAAREIVRKRMKAPSQASFPESEVLETSENYALVYLVVEAPNVFGVRLQRGYCVVVQFQPPRGNEYAWHRAAGAVECEGHPDEAAAWSIKAANGWPGLGDPPASLTADAKPRRRRHR